VEVSDGNEFGRELRGAELRSS